MGICKPLAFTLSHFKVLSTEVMSLITFLKDYLSCDAED